MARSMTLPNVLVVAGALVGGTLGWWLGHLLGFILAAHVAILVGFWLAPTRKRLGFSLLMTFLMWWPAWLGQWFWD